MPVSLIALSVYLLYFFQVGYCQGSAFLVGALLLQMTEEDAFTVVVKLMDDYRLREMYKPTMAELGLCIYQLECLVQVNFVVFESILKESERDDLSNSPLLSLFSLLLYYRRHYNCAD